MHIYTPCQVKGLAKEEDQDSYKFTILVSPLLEGGR